MKTYSIQSNIYATPEGVVTHDASEGKNTLVLASGAVISLKEAERLNLPALEAAATIKATEVADHLSELKPFGEEEGAKTVSALPTEVAAESSSAPIDTKIPPSSLSPTEAESAASALSEAAANAQKAADALTGAAGATEQENQS